MFHATFHFPPHPFVILGTFTVPDSKRVVHFLYRQLQESSLPVSYSRSRSKRLSNSCCSGSLSAQRDITFPSTKEENMDVSKNRDKKCKWLAG